MFMELLSITVITKEPRCILVAASDLHAWGQNTIINNQIDMGLQEVFSVCIRILASSFVCRQTNLLDNSGIVELSLQCVQNGNIHHLHLVNYYFSLSPTKPLCCGFFQDNFSGLLYVYVHSNII